MVLTKIELLAALQHEVRVLQHLITKINPEVVDYRPTPKQRSTLELLRYLSIMGPGLIKAVKAGAFDPPTWTVTENEAKARNFEQTVQVLAAQAEDYNTLLSGFTDEDFRTEVEMFGRKTTRGSFIVSMVLGGHAAYRTQLFLYLKSCGRDELGTWDLWAGTDAPAPATAG